MKITNISDPKGFFEMLKQCTGNIELVTEDGDRLNLKSKLCQYIAMTDIFSNAEIGSPPTLLVGESNKTTPVSLSRVFSSSYSLSYSPSETVGLSKT